MEIGLDLQIKLNNLYGTAAALRYSKQAKRFSTGYVDRPVSRPENTFSAPLRSRAANVSAYAIALF